MRPEIKMGSEKYLLDIVILVTLTIDGYALKVFASLRRLVTEAGTCAFADTIIHVQKPRNVLDPVIPDTNQPH